MNSKAFTVLELLAVLIIIAILAVMLVPALATIKSRSEKTACMMNLRNLYIAGNAYLQQNGQWPQIPVATTDNPQSCEQWIDAFAAMGVSRSSWVCPTMQKLMGSPPINNSQVPRVDYIAFPFDSKPMTPFEWNTTPWFTEKGNVHGNGNLLIFRDGSIKELNDLVSLLSGT